MEINRDWWDGETYDFTARSESGTLLAQIVNTTMETKILADFDKYNGEWDKSVSPWKINYNSALFSKAWALTWNDGTNLNTKFSRFYKERKKGYTFYLATQGLSNNADYDGNATYPYMYTPNYYSTLTNPDIDLENNTYTAALHNKYGYIKPVIKFNYGRLFTIPVIHYKFNNLDYARSLQTTDETNFDASKVTGFSFGFYYLDRYGSLREFPIGLFSLNNPIIPPYWSEWNTNCWKTNEIDNGCMLLSYRYRRNEQYLVRSDIGNSLQFESENGTTYYSNTTPTESAAATLNYFPAKQIPTFTNALTDRAPDIFDDNWQSYYVSGSGYWYNSIYRNCKSSVTFEEFVDYIKLQAAYIGFRFCPFYDKATQGINSEYFYIPEIDSVGVTTGNYFQANTAEAQLQQNYTWGTDVYERTPYDGTNDDEEDDPNTYSDSSGWNDTNYVDPNLSFTQVYLLDDYDVGGLGSKFYESLSIKPTDQLVSEFFAETYLTTEPTDVIISLRYFNINLEDNVSHSSTKQALSFGTYDTSVMAYTVTKTTERYSYGEHLYYPHFGDFRDYAPYSSAILIIPYCGSVDIDPAEFMGHWIRVQMVIDFVTGTCTAYILKDELIVNSISGQIGIEVPVTAIAAQDLSRNLFNGYQNLKSAKLSSAQGVAQGAMSFIGAAASSNPLGMASAAMNTLFAAEQSQIGVETAEYNLEHTRIPFRQVGSINPASAFKQEQACRLIIFRPEMDAAYDAETYGHITGFKTLENDYLANYTGYTVCAAADTSGITATLRERQQLKELLLSGIYL